MQISKSKQKNITGFLSSYFFSEFWLNLHEKGLTEWIWYNTRPIKNQELP